MKYRVLLQPDEDGQFVAEVPALPGCISQGKSRDEALRNVKEAIALYLESLQAHGDAVPPPHSGGDRRGRERRLSVLPRISGREAVKAFAKLGYVFDRQRGSHIILRHVRSPFRRLVVPDHPGIAKGALRALIREAGISVEEFRELL